MTWTRCSSPRTIDALEEGHAGLEARFLLDRWSLMCERRHATGIWVALLAVAWHSGAIAQSAESACEKTSSPSLGEAADAASFQRFDFNGNNQLDPGCETDALRQAVNRRFSAERWHARLSRACLRHSRKRPRASLPTSRCMPSSETTSASATTRNFSIDYQLFRDREGALGKVLPTDQLHFSYSQTSLWDFSLRSGPFRDSSYRPRLFYRRNNMLAEDWNLQLDVGLGHESNGRAGALSRSTSIAYLRPTFTFGDASGSSGSQWFVRPMMYAYLER
jgi:hypothetical protein